MDKKYIKENMLIERYLEDTLSIEEREAFEDQFLSSAELLDEASDIITVREEMEAHVLAGPDGHDTADEDDDEEELTATHPDDDNVEEEDLFFRRDPFMDDEDAY